jgi:hypothetical protein
MHAHPWLLIPRSAESEAHTAENATLTDEIRDIEEQRALFDALRQHAREEVSVVIVKGWALCVWRGGRCARDGVISDAESLTHWSFEGVGLAFACTAAWFMRGSFPGRVWV